MLTADQYTKASAHRIVIKHVAEGGSSPSIPLEIYKIAEEIGAPPVNLTCNSCKADWIKTLYELIKEYENGKR